MKRNVLFFALILLTSPLLHAQGFRNAVEASQNQQAMAANKAQLERDVKELAAYKAKLVEFEKAFTAKNVARTAKLKGDLLFAMQREIEQSEKKIAQDKHELSQSQAEVASSNRESRRSRFDRRTEGNNVKNGHAVRDDRRDRRDDQRDARDDRADLEQQIARTQHQKQIYASLQTVTFSFEPTLYEKAVANKALFQAFAATMEKDIAATQIEIAEDKREAAEDRRERREDRRDRVIKRRNW